MTSKLIELSTGAILLGTVCASADVSVSSKPTSNMDCAGGVCTATAQKAVLNVGDLANLLASGDVAVKTGTLAKDIDVDQPLTWSNTSRLTLDAQQSVEINKQVTVAGTGNLTVTTNDTGNNGKVNKAKNQTGEFVIVPEHGSVQFWDMKSSLIIDGNSYTLVNDIKTLAADIAANPSGSYALANSYDAKQDEFDTVPIPTPFSGTFEGLGQTISNLKLRHHIQRREGLFAYVDYSGTIQDLNLAKVDGRSSDHKISVGSLAGTNLGQVSHLAVSGSIRGSAYQMGGVVGDNEGGIEDVSSSVNIAGTASEAGGIAGSSGPAGHIARSHANGSISGGGAGGLVGSGSNITLSFAIGRVTATGSAGGLAGGGDHIDQSFATGPVVGGNNGALAGGLVGNGSLISNSYATGAVQVGSHKVLAGGLVGYAADVITCYSTGAVIAGKGSYVGGFLGRGDRDSVLDYWDTDTSGKNVGCGKGNCAGVTGLSTEQLKSQLPAGFDSKIWGQAANINGGFPYLRANQPPN